MPQKELQLVKQYGVVEILNRIKLQPRVTISAEDLRMFFPQKCNVVCRDPAYNTTSMESMKRFCQLWSWIVPPFKWTKRRDCDNYADAFKGFNAWFNPTQAIGVILVDRGYDLHALNCFFSWDEDNGFDVAYIEPQTGAIYTPEHENFRNWRVFDVRL